MSKDASGPRSGSSTQLPVVGQLVRERADAARNRAKIFAAASALFRSRGVSGVSMDEIAASAGVGKGTLFRRFGDKRGLVIALLDEREQELQGRILRGEPPLGPGAEPVARLVAFVHAYVSYVFAEPDLLIVSETAHPGARFSTGAYAFWRQHCALLLGQAGAPDPQLRAELLLAALSGEQLAHWKTAAGLDEGPIAEQVAGLARLLAG
jgi:AcrR family transcriptional regulator